MVVLAAVAVVAVAAAEAVVDRAVGVAEDTAGTVVAEVDTLVVVEAFPS